jgi:hypothetical protein
VRISEPLLCPLIPEVHLTHRIAQESDGVSLTCLVCLYHVDQFPQDIYVCSYLLHREQCTLDDRIASKGESISYYDNIE